MIKNNECNNIASILKLQYISWQRGDKMKIRFSDTVYGIGIDTGGTYTDAVLFDLREHKSSYERQKASCYPSRRNSYGGIFRTYGNQSVSAGKGYKRTPQAH